MLTSTTYSQQTPEAKRANHWYFGNGAGLDFSSGSPVAVTDGKLHAKEGSATMSDLNGNLLFYTDGDTVWDKNHNVMPNGAGLAGCGNFNNSSNQGVLVVPMPNSDSIYYVFTNDCGGNLDENFGALGFNYTVININLNGGTGDIISKNNLLFSPSTEMLAGTIHHNGVDIWIITHELNNTKFRSYLLTGSGLNSTPIISDVGIPHNYYSSIEISPNSELIAVADDNIQLKNILYTFDNNTGKLEVLTYLNSQGGERWVSFSPDNSKLYYTASGNVFYSYDLCDMADTVTIQNSFKIIDISNNNSDYVSLQISSDNKLYIAGSYTDSISTLIYPNSANGFYRNVIELKGRTSSEDLPNFTDYYFNQNSSCNILIEKEISIPNIFTPNNDGINDFFSTKTEGYSELNYIIYNRWGIEFKRGNQRIINANTNLWDGYITNGIKAPNGVYYYLINLIQKDGNSETKKGFFQLIY